MSINFTPFDSPIECMTIDTETTGLDPAGGDEILTLAMVLDIDGQDSPSTVHLRVRPQHKTEWPDAERVNHISPASVAGYKPFERYVEAVQFLFDRTEKIVGWNVNFDLGFLENEGVVIPQTAEIVDAMEDFGRAYGPFSETHSRWRLTSAADAVGYSFEGAPHTPSPMPWLPGIYIYTPSRSSKAIDIRGQMSNAPELTGISRKLSPCGTKPVCTGGLYGENCIWGRPSVRPQCTSPEGGTSNARRERRSHACLAHARAGCYAAGA